MGFKAGSFIDGLNSGLSLGERMIGLSEKGKTKREMDAISSAKPEESTGYTAEDGQYLEGLASARDPNGAPYYKVAADESGNYVVQANREAQGFGLSDYQGGTDPTTVSQRKVTDYLGDRTAGGLSDADISKKKGLAMADVVSRTDPEKGSRMRREVTQNEREDQRYAREQKTWEQQDQAAAAETDFKKAYRDAYQSTTYAQRMSEYTPQAEAYKQALAEREAALKAGAPPESLGPAPQEPEKPGYSVAESLADHGALLDMRIKAGKADPSEVTKYAESLKKVQEEGYVKALQLGQSGASLDTIANAFNQNGSVKFDPRTVVSDEMVAGADGVKTRVIKVKDPKTGQVQTIDTLGELDSLGKAASYYDRFYKAQSASAKDKPPSGYQWSQDGKSLSYVPGGPADPATKPAKTAGNSTLERMLLSDQRNNAEAQERAALKEASDLEKQISEDRDLRIALNKGKESEHWPRLQEKQAEIKAAKQAAAEAAGKKKEYSQMLEEMTREVVGSRTSSKTTEKPAASMGLSSTWNSPERENDRMRILQSELARAKQSGNAGDVAALEREIARAGGQTMGLSAMQQPTRQASSQPVKVTTAAEHAALPKGTRYTAPDGSVRIKQ